MVTFEDIKKANSSVQTTDIKGKSYTEVNQRIKAFRMVYPDGFIVTEMLSNSDGICIFKASVGYYDDMKGPYTLGVGTAYEKEGSTFINKTSYIENCETSAVGRALGMAGFGIDTSVASAEEVQTAMLNQTASMHISDLEATALAERCKSDGVDEGKILKLYKVKNLKSLTQRQFANINANLDKIRREK